MMGRKAVSMTGERHGRLVVQERVYPEDITSTKNTYYRCVCDCGETSVVTRSNLLHNVVSCGCYQRELASERATTHGESGTRLHGIWNSIKSRCYIPSSGNAKYYHDRGIRMSDSWKNDYTAFRDWALQLGWNEHASYKDMLTVDRKDNDGDYSEENCQLSTWRQQCMNRREKGTA
jgi:hypothetical protein